MGEYRMHYLGRKNGKHWWRGTGFNPKRGGITWVSQYWNVFAREFSKPWWWPF